MFKQLEDMALFVLVIESGSFTAAANQVGLPKSSVSQRISQLEQHLGLRLLNRTTRKLSLTFAGERYLVHCQEMVAASERANNALQMIKSSPSGRVRITAPAGLAATLLATVVTDFHKTYPDISIEVHVSDDMNDLVAGGYDLALRTGKPKDSELIGRYLGGIPRYLVASPHYLAQHEPITQPEQLAQHAMIVHRSWTQCVLQHEQQIYHWLLPANHLTDNLLYARQCALLGNGMTILPDFLCQELLENQQLQTVLSDWQIADNELYLIYPSRKLNAPAITLFIESVVNHPAIRRYMN